MSIGWIMFCKAIVLAIFATLKSRYVSWKSARTVTLAFDGKAYYDPLPVWERRAWTAWQITIVAVVLMAVGATLILFIGL